MNIENYDRYLKERIQIGSGSRSQVYSWNNYAYKCYSQDYKKDWIKHEYDVQKQINDTNLNVVKFYDTSFENTTKMDLIKGKTIAYMLLNEDKQIPFDLFMNEYDKIHEIKDLDLEDVSDFLIRQVNNANVTHKQKQKALNYIDDIENTVNEDKVLCHMDYHFLNTMYDGDKVFILDWFDAKNGKKIYDFSRTYVIMFQYAAGYKLRFLKRVLNKYAYDKELFKKAVYINAVNRLQNFENKKMRHLIDLIEQDKW